MSTTTITGNISGSCGFVRTESTAPTAFGGGSSEVVTSNATVTTSITQDNIGGVTESGDSIVLPPHVKKAKITLPFPFTMGVSNSTSDYSFSLVGPEHSISSGSTESNVSFRIHCIDGNGAELANVLLVHSGGPAGNGHYYTYTSSTSNGVSYSHSIDITAFYPLSGGMTITPLGESTAERTITLQLRATDNGNGTYGASTVVL